ncbi:mechanosensitive ion channel family protein [Paenibacillus glycanilyticus]|uniref:mechanosensitive ion channel family protein n=1 Tax=Paenibacillus glycanilyticus TaxID=126569 RepID=UPI00203DB3EF|nr:mechanosensitive ion channel family protein [Paenibacillus glycanilyticus]MCM3629698.1 mechanosensitive ion channel family protein [Paenibacillus glycanilyticus]
MNYIKELLVELGMNTELAVYLANIILVVIVGIVSVAANFVTKKIVLRVVTHYIRNNRYQWDDYLLERKVFHKLSHIVPAIILYYFSFSFSSYQSLIHKGITVYLIIVALLVLDAFLNAVNDIYRTFDISRSRPIKGYVQVVKIFLFIIGGILAISNLIGESPVILISGIGALSAVMLLIFKDSLLGLVAGVQLSTNDMVQVGDWIEMPKYGADGDIIDISLHTVKVQNFDKTITTIPSYALISDSFKNWRGMQDAGGRRIKRAVYLDMNSIGFCTPAMIEKFKRIHLLADYILDKEKEISYYNLEHDIDHTVPVNGRAMTNIGVFRAYIERYIEQHPKIHKGMTRIVRQLAPGENGLPLEIYAFTNDINWAVYEGVQSDLFDHILAVAPEFGLQVFQNPSGHDFSRSASKVEAY